MSHRFPEFTASGTPRELGREIGEQLGELIRGFCTSALEQVNRTMKVSRANADRVIHTSLPLAEAYAPDMVEELRGTAEAARVSLEDMLLLQVRNQLQADDAGCTSFSLWGESGRIVAQNWDNDPLLDPLTVVLTRRPQGKPALTTVTQAGLIAYIGFNEAGIGLCLNTLPAPSRTRGVPHYFTVRGIYESDSLEGAVAAVRRAERAIPANIMLTTPQGPADLEVTIDDVRVLTDMNRKQVTHANHCRHPELLAINDQFPELIGSRGRQARIDLLLTDDGGHDEIPRAMEALRDHDGHPRSICRHPNDDPAHGHWCTVISAIIEPAARRMFLTRGTPCDRAYEVYEMR
ncbi:MAG: peptidase C45 [Planctomycetaceae bacterium]|nr:peptidase C45 [Planctomycetaceae bacterium]